ncbi:MAG: ATP-binding response regulator [Phycisphaerae bacterium]
MTRALLADAGVICLSCRTVPELVHQFQQGAGAILLTEDAFATQAIQGFVAALSQQPAWSEIPIVILARSDGTSPISAQTLTALRNVTILERPAPMRSLASAIQSAVRSRQRQYQIRDQIEEIQRSQKEREQLLESERAARGDAERANRLKDEFLATVSHELRTPLNAILGWTQVLSRMANDPKEVREGAEIIERNARLQAQLIDDLLDMSRIISGKVRLDKRLIDPAAVVAAAIASVQPSAEAAGIRVEQHIERAGQVLADPGRFQQILWNFLSNAIKFTAAGGTISVSLRPAEGHIELRVADTGKGITPEFLPHVFERFRQADATTTRKFGGLGLGLAIVKHLVELHGGSISVASEGENRGATFTVLFPRVAPQEAGVPSDGDASARARHDHPDLAGVRILVVDDDDDARRLLRRLLVECHAEVTTAPSAREALQLVPTFRPDVLVSDIGMPEMDGYAFIDSVRSTVADAEALPAIAVTAFARPEDRTRALRAGYQRHISKPVEPAEFLSMVAALAHRDS